MGKRSPSRSPSHSPKRQKEDVSGEKVKERGRSASRSSSSDRSRSTSRSSGSSGSRSRSRSRSRSSRSRSHSRDDRRSRSRSRSRADRRRRSRSRSRSQGRRNDDRRRASLPRRDDRRGGRQNGGSAGAPADGLQQQQPAEAAPPRERKALAAGPAGGVYIPPFKLAQMMAEAADKESAQYQRMTWDALRKSINGLVNKVNASNIKHILPEVFSENLIRGRGLFCRSIMKSQMASPAFTPVYAALVAVVNTKFPEIGELLLHRVVTQFKRAYKRNDKPVCSAAIKFIAHLANQQVVHELLPLEILLLLLETPSDDGVEVSVDFIKEVGPLLMDLAPSGLTTIMDRLRRIVSEGDVDIRTQYIVEGLFSLRKANFEGKKPVPEELELVETEDQITHEVTLEDALEPQMFLDVFKEDPEFKQHEEEYAAIKREILGEESGEEEESSESERERGSGEEEEESEEESEDEEETEAQQRIQDETQTNLVNLRRTIYLTIMSALDFEEAGHKLMKLGIPAGQEMELTTMIIECCSNEKTFIKYYALLGERFCKIKREYADCFAEAFVRQYQLIHRLETNKLRNTAKLFAHLLSTDAIPWAILQVIRLTEEDTTSSSRIFIKILFQELAETLGLVNLNKRLNDPSCQDWFEGVFPKDSPRNMRFSINFFTSIGLGGLTEKMREVLKNLPKLIAAQQAAAAAAAAAAGSSSSDDSSSSSDSSSDSDSGSSSSSSGTSSSSSSSDDSSSSSGSSSSDTSSSSESEEEDKGGRQRGGSKGRRSPPAPPPRARGDDRERDAERAPAEERPRRAVEGGEPAAAANGRDADRLGGDRRVEERRREERKERRDSRERQQRERARSDSRDRRRGGEERPRGGDERRREDERRRRDRSDSRDRRRR